MCTLHVIEAIQGYKHKAFLQFFKVLLDDLFTGPTSFWTRNVQGNTMEPGLALLLQD